MSMQSDRVDTVVRGGLVVTAGGAIEADIAIRDGKIAAVGGDASALAGTKEIDAAGKIVFPGFIDCHCHFRGWEDYGLASRMAAASGLTTIIPFGITDPENAESLLGVRW